MAAAPTSRGERPAFAAEALLRALADHGADDFFCNPSTGFPPAVEAFSRAKKTNTKVPKPVLVPHENLAVSMAHGAYPMTGRPDRQLPQGWDDIPGARGCTPETCGFRDHHKDLAKLHADVFGVSTQDTAYQQEMVKRLEVPFEVLSDEHMAFTRALRLPTFTAGGMTLLKRLTIVARRGRVEHVFYPVFPPDTHAELVIGWLKQHPLRS